MAQILIRFANAWKTLNAKTLNIFAENKKGIYQISEPKEKRNIMAGSTMKKRKRNCTKTIWVNCQKQMEAFECCKLKITFLN